MSRKGGVRAGIVVAFAMMLALVAPAAVAAGGATPKLLSPNHKRVNPGKIRLVVNIPLRPSRHGVFITISTSRRLSHGHLSECSAKRCDFVGATHWKGTKYSYVAQFDFPGYWAVTRGKYYWQVHYYKADFTADYYSSIGSFFVK